MTFARRPLAGGFLLLTLGCAAGRAQETKETDDQKKGHALVLLKCSECHTLKRVFAAHYGVLEWNETVDRMIDHAKQSDPGFALPAAERTLVVDYLVSQNEPKTSLGVVGQLHFVFLHFPIALLFTLGFLEFLAVTRGRPLAGFSRHILCRLLVVLTIPTIALGLCLSSERGSIPPLLVYHRNIGIVTGVLVVILWLSRETATRKGALGPAAIYWVTLLAAIASVALTGHLGGELVHGEYLEALLKLLRG